MSLLYGAKFISQEVAANRPHILGHNTARTVANDTLLEVWNGPTNASRKAAIDKDGKLYSAAWAAGDLPYVVAGSVTSLKRMDTLPVGTARKVLQVNAGGTAPEWTDALSIVSLATSGNATVSGVLAALGVSSEPILAVQRTVDAGAHQYSLRVDGSGNGYVRDDTRAVALLTFTAATGAAAFAGLVTASAGLTVANGQTLTLTGVTVTGAPTWGSSQAITLSTAAQPNITSVGTLTALTVSGLITANTLTASGPITANAGLTVASGQALTLTGATVAGTPTWSSSQAITLSTAAQPNVTSLGSLTGLTMAGTLTMGANTLALATATVSGTPTWSSSQAITLSTAAQPNITSVGTLTSVAVSGTSTLSGVVTSSGQPRAKAFGSGDQTTSAGVDWAVDVPWDSETFDVGAMHSTSSSTERITVPTGGDGLYLIHAHLEYLSSAVGGSNNIVIVKNAATQLARTFKPTSAANDVQSMDLTVLAVLAAGDYVKLQAAVAHVGAGAATIKSDSYLEAVKLW